MTGVAPVLFPLGAAAIVAAAILTNLGMGGIALSTVLIVSAVLWLIGLIRKANAGWIAGGLVYTGLPLVAVIMIRSSVGPALAAIVFIFAAVWVTDSAAYLSGRAIGGPKLWPAVSPNKTWAGLIGGMAGASIFGAIFALTSSPSNLAWLAILGAILAFVSQGGDLFESSVKRRFGVKDSGNLIPGHGGIMDRVDGMVAAVLFAAMMGISRSGFDNVAAGILEWR